MSTLSALVQQSPTVHIRQKKEWTEIITDWETKNRYEISFPGGQQLVAGEVSSGLMAQLMRGFLKSKRPFTMEVREPSGGLALRVERPWTWLFSRADVYDGAGRRLGSIEQQFSIFSKRFELKRADGVVFAELEGPLFRPWTFHLKKAGREAGKITKQWSGLFREMASDADDFGMELSPSIAGEERLVCLGAVFLIDFCYFEDRG